MRTWKRNGYEIVEQEFNYDLHGFAILINSEVAHTITPDDLESQEAIIEALDAGEDVDGWEDGMGNTIRLSLL